MLYTRHLKNPIATNYFVKLMEFLVFLRHQLCTLPKSNRVLFFLLFSLFLCVHYITPKNIAFAPPVTYTSKIVGAQKRYSFRKLRGYYFRVEPIIIKSQIDGTKAVFQFKRSIKALERNVDLTSTLEI